MKTTAEIVNFNDVTSIPNVDITETVTHSEWTRIKNNKNETFFIGRVKENLIVKFHPISEHLYLLTEDEFVNKAEKFGWTQVDIDNYPVSYEETHDTVEIAVDDEQDLDTAKDVLNKLIGFVFKDKPSHLKAINKFISENV